MGRGRHGWGEREEGGGRQELRSRSKRVTEITKGADIMICTAFTLQNTVVPIQEQPYKRQAGEEGFSIERR